MKGYITLISGSDLYSLTYMRDPDAPNNKVIRLKLDPLSGSLVEGFEMNANYFDDTYAMLSTGID